jgi:hypothetical protein
MSVEKCPLDTTPGSSRSGLEEREDCPKEWGRGLSINKFLEASILRKF